jgi:hypothetical protein
MRQRVVDAERCPNHSAERNSHQHRGWLNAAGVPIATEVAGRRDRIGGLGGGLAPGDPTFKVLRVEDELAAVRGQHPLGHRVEHCLSTLRVQVRPTAIASRPTAAPGELVRVKKVVGREEALAAVDRRQRAHREKRLAGEVTNVERNLTPRDPLARFQPAVRAN